MQEGHGRWRCGWTARGGVLVPGLLHAVPEPGRLRRPGSAAVAFR
ncbi:hypothetical protein KPATCC21470_8605 [Kitasatospora purpeofusca]